MKFYITYNGDKLKVVSAKENRNKIYRVGWPGGVVTTARRGYNAWTMPPVSHASMEEIMKLIEAAEKEYKNKEGVLTRMVKWFSR